MVTSLAGLLRLPLALVGPRRRSRRGGRRCHRLADRSGLPFDEPILLAEPHHGLVEKFPGHASVMLVGHASRRVPEENVFQARKVFVIAEQGRRRLLQRLRWFVDACLLPKSVERTLDVVAFSKLPPVFVLLGPNGAAVGVEAELDPWIRWPCTVSASEMSPARASSQRPARSRGRMSWTSSE